MSRLSVYRLLNVLFVILHMMCNSRAQIPDLEVLCGQYSVFCASSCQTYQKQCAPTFGEIGLANNNIPLDVIGSRPAESSQNEKINILDLLPGSETAKPCRAKNSVCSSNKDCCLDFFCKLHKQTDGYVAKIGTCQIPYYLNKIVPRGNSREYSFI